MRNPLPGLTSCASLALLVWCLAGCGGVAKGGDSGGNAGSGSVLSCQYAGKTYADGASFPSDDGCNSCSCGAGQVGCTARACADTCVYGGKTHPIGLSFPSDDGCNTCSCSAAGQVSCTNLACAACQGIADAYAAAVDSARICDPKQTAQCTMRFADTLACACGTFVNPENGAAIAEAQALQSKYEGLSCGGEVVCEPCLPQLAGVCSTMGRCEPITDPRAGGTACKVNGVVYASGQGGIPDPTSCNKCSCSNGQLSCTEIYCPVACPPNTAYGTQCAECGPTDACLVVEHGCLPTCVDTCSNGSACSAGVCRNFCG